ncbi:hypothetical protein BUPH_06821 [Paraburkholderia phenoliruptrix BR3459a]|uniref:Uncharacterized protein n=1 Tax=Paraburkholderia phenoliruptrix BR3459a TaxID=1229205 RepID=K0DJR6_9BURK|nr:hypothetical protein BUPH_06821 [Paraburkholderia phenoliruptrix BR3459a]
MLHGFRLSAARSSRDRHAMPRDCGAVAAPAFVRIVMFGAAFGPAAGPLPPPDEAAARPVKMPGSPFRGVFY